MKINLPNGKRVVLDDDISFEKKIAKVESILLEWDEYIHSSWIKDKDCKLFLEKLANYLVWHKEDEESKHIEDKEVMSRNKINRISRGAKDIPFSSLSNQDKILIDGGE